MELDISQNGHTLLPPADWAAEIEKLQENIRTEQEKNLRTLADFKNYRRRIERDGIKFVEESKRGMILPMLEIIDDLEKALQSANEADLPTVKGVQIIHKKFLSLLGAYGVVPFNSIGSPFDHNMHEAVAMEKLDGSESGIVVDELRRGYLWNNELLRAAQVRVSGW